MRNEENYKCIIIGYCTYKFHSFAKDSETIMKEETPSYKAILLGDDKGKIYYSENIDEKYPLASLTKMMTLMVTFDQLEKGNIKMKDKIKVSKKSAQTGGSRIFMKEGDVFTLEDLIKATAIYSANNAAYAIAEYIGKGDVDKFVKMMNKKSADLGLEKELEFYTPAGLPSDMTKKGMDAGTTRGIYKLSLQLRNIINIWKLPLLKKLLSIMEN